MAAANPEKIDSLLVKADFFLKKGHYNDVLAACHEILTADPLNVPAAILEAEVLLQNNKADTALATLNSISFNDPVPGEPLQEKQLRILILKVKAFIYLNRFAEGEKTLNLILHHNHTHFEAVELLGDLDLDRGRFQSAIRIYKSLLSRNWNNKQIRFSLGQTFLKTRQYPQAYDCFLQLKTDGVKDRTVLSLLEESRNHLTSSALKAEVSGNFFDHFLQRIFPSLADEKTSKYVGETLANQHTGEDQYIDPLTGCKNAQAVSAQLSNFHTRRKGTEPVFLGLIELDYLEAINLCLSHDVGNETIHSFGTFLLESFGENVYRIEGNRFLFCIEGAGTTTTSTVKVLRAKVESTLQKFVNQALVKKPAYDHDNKPLQLLWPVTCSIGYSTWPASIPLENALAEAQTALTQATLPTVGRNAVYFKSTLQDKGVSPVNYTPRLIRRLNEIAIEKNHPDWWDLSIGLTPATFKETLNQAVS